MSFSCVVNDKEQDVLYDILMTKVDVANRRVGTVQFLQDAGLLQHFKC